MAYSDSYKTYVDEQLEGIDGLYAKKMFGGVGYFVDGVIFACIMGGKLRLKVDETNQAQFEELGMKGYEIPGKNRVMPYFEIPEKILEDKEELHKWALQSLEIGVKTKKKKKK